MIKRLLAALFAVTMIFNLCSCGGLVDTREEEDNGNALKLDGDLLCGFFIYFDDLDNGKSFPTADFDSEDAIKHYWRLCRYEGSESTYLQLCGSEELADVKDDMTNEFSFCASSSVESEATLYYTAELIHKVMRILLVYHTPDGELYTVGQIGELISSSPSEHEYSQNANAKTTDTQGESETVLNEITYDCKITIKTKLIDDLVGVNVFEYGLDGNLIAEYEYTRGEEFAASSECAYVIIEEEYEVSEYAPDHRKEDKGEKYSIRTALNRGEDKTIELKYPQENGLVSFENLKVAWE